MNIDFIGTILYRRITPSISSNFSLMYVAWEQQVFSLDLPLSLFPLYAPAAYAAQGGELVKIAKKVQLHSLVFLYLPIVTFNLK